MNFSETGQNWTISQNLFFSSPEKFCCDRTVLSFELPERRTGGGMGGCP